MMLAFFPLNANLLSHITLAIILASKLILFTIGLNMIYSVLKFSNFSHAEFITLGFYASWWGLQMVSYILPLFGFIDEAHIINNIFLHACIAFIIGGLVGIIGEVLVFRPLRSKAATATTLTVASIGFGLIIRNLLSMVFTDFPEKRGNFGGICPQCSYYSLLPDPIVSLLKLIPFYDSSRGQFIIQFTTSSDFWGTQSIRITDFDLFIIFIAIITVLIIDYIFKNTKFGIAMRATSDSFELAQVSGINTKRIVVYTWFLAAGITGMASTFVRATQPIFTSADGALFWLLPVFAVAILGGVGSFKGGIIASFILAFARQGTFLLFTEWQKQGNVEDILNIVTFSPSYADAVGFVVLIIVLLLRPQGIMGSVEATRARV